MKASWPVLVCLVYFNTTKLQNLFYLDLKGFLRMLLVRLQEF